jgi:hypothetical protein
VRLQSSFPQIYIHEHSLISLFRCYSSFEVAVALHGDTGNESSPRLYIANITGNIHKYYDNCIVLLPMFAAAMYIFCSAVLACGLMPYCQCPPDCMAVVYSNASLLHVRFFLLSFGLEGTRVHCY